MRRTWPVWVLVGALILAGCSDDPDSAQPPTREDSSSSAPATAVPTTPIGPGDPTIDGMFRAAGKYRLAVQCWGEGSPTVVYDAGTGDSGLDELRYSSSLVELSQKTQVCSYDRAGTGASDPAPNRPRSLDEVVDDMHAVMLSAGVRPPYLLVGSSGGGFDIYQYAGRFPKDVVGLVMLDVPHGQADIDFGPTPAWKSPDNPEHVAYDEVERQMDLDRLPIPPIPVTVLSATMGQSEDLNEQKVWLAGSSRPRQVIVESGHDVFNENPEAAVKGILGVLAAAAR